MKTKTLITAFFVFAIIVNTNAFSQDYHPLLNHSSWIIYDMISCCRPPVEKTIEEATDTVIGSKTYKKFIDPFGNYNNYPTTVYLREDITEKKVYRLVSGTEVLVYDFSLNNSDIILNGGNHFTATVDSINVIGGSRKRITLKSIEHYCGKQLTQVWIEGVGSNRHPFYPDYNIMIVCSSGGGYNIFTKCSFQNGIHIYGNSECSSPLSVQDLSSEAKGIELFPNPASDMLYVHFPNSTETLESITVYDLLGKMVQKVSGIAANQPSFSVSSLAKGMYLVEITTQNNMKTTKRLIVN